MSRSSTGRQLLHRYRWLGLLLALVGAWVLWRAYAPAPRAPVQDRNSKPPAVTVATARIDALHQDVHALGTVTPLTRVLIRPQVDGHLERLHFAEGQDVEAGQLLAEIDARPFELALAAALGQLARTEAVWRNAQADLARYERLGRSDSVAASQLDAARAQERGLAAQYQRDTAGVAEARRQLALTRIVAPSAGRLGLREIDAGNHVRAADTTGLVTLVQTHPISVVFSVPAATLPLLSEALGARSDGLRVQAWDANDRVLLAEGELHAQDNRIETGRGSLRLRALFDNPAEALYPNQFVNVRLVLLREAEALMVPAAAVQYAADGPFVYVIGEGDRAERRALVLGDSRPGEVAVREGLAAGERIVVEGVDRVRVDREVTIVPAQG